MGKRSFRRLRVVKLDDYLLTVCFIDTWFKNRATSYRIQKVGSCYTTVTDDLQDENLASMQGALYDKSYYMCDVAGVWNGEWWRRIQCGDAEMAGDVVIIKKAA